mgnify:CR=1 FL=1
MTQVSKYVVNKDVEERMYEVFLDSVAMVKTRGQVVKLIDDLFSPTEKIMLAKRLSIALLLFKKYDQRAIAKILRVSLATVNKISRALQKGVGGYAMVVSSIAKQEKFHAFLEKIDDTLADLLPPAHRNWSHWRRERWEEKIRNKKPF